MFEFIALVGVITNKRFAGRNDNNQGSESARIAVVDNSNSGGNIYQLYFSNTLPFHLYKYSDT